MGLGVLLGVWVGVFVAVWVSVCVPDPESVWLQLTDRLKELLLVPPLALRAADCDPDPLSVGADAVADSVGAAEKDRRLLREAVLEGLGDSDALPEEDPVTDRVPRGVAE